MLIFAALATLFALFLGYAVLAAVMRGDVRYALFMLIPLVLASYLAFLLITTIIGYSDSGDLIRRLLGL